MGLRLSDRLRCAQEVNKMDRILIDFDGGRVGTRTPGLLRVKQSVERHDRTGGAIADPFECHLIKLDVTAAALTKSVI